MKFEITWLGTVTKVMEMDNIDAAEAYANEAAKNAIGECRVLSIVREGVVIEHYPPRGPKGSGPRGGGPHGGTPGTPVVKKNVLADAVAA